MEFKTLYLDISVTFGLKANNCRHVLLTLSSKLPSCGIIVLTNSKVLIHSSDIVVFWCSLCDLYSDISGDSFWESSHQEGTHKAIHVFCGKAIEKPLMKSLNFHTQSTTGLKFQKVQKLLEVLTLRKTERKCGQSLQEPSSPLLLKLHFLSCSLKKLLWRWDHFFHSRLFL